MKIELSAEIVRFIMPITLERISSPIKTFETEGQKAYIQHAPI